jgi:hypothetical protein
MRSAAVWSFVTAAVLIPAVAVAQDLDSVFAPGERPPPARKAADPPKRLDLTLSLHEAIDSTRLSDTVPRPDPIFRNEAGFTSATASVNFSNTSGGLSFGALGATNIRHFTLDASSIRSDFYGAMNITAPLGNRLTGRASQRMSYSPYYAFGDLLQDDETEADEVLLTDQSIVRFSTYRARTSGALTYTLAPRSTLDVKYQLEVVDASSGNRASLGQGANFGFRRRLTQYTDLRVGYGYRRSQVGTVASSFESHDINTGVSYGRPLSASRRTFVSFRTSGSIVVREDQHPFFFTGQGSLNHALSRTWVTGVTYRRSISAYAGFADPYLVDAVSGRLTGQLSHKLGLSGSGGYTNSRVAVDLDNGFATVYARARLLYALNRYLPVFGEYVYYHYRFDRPVGPSVNLPLFMTRHGLRAGLFYTMPLIGRRPTP